MHTQVYVGLGGNSGDSVDFLNQALEKIQKIPGVFGLECSGFYRTTPVGPTGQRRFVNAVCRFQTGHSVKETYRELASIETELGKVPKGKYEPRVIDLDLLFFGDKQWIDEELCVPHPFWDDRLFVLVPLAEIAEEIFLPEGRFRLSDLVESFHNRHREAVKFLTEPKGCFYGQKSGLR